MNLIDFLSAGQAHAKTAADLRRLLGYKDTREITKTINRLRNQGFVILSATGESKNRGYFLPGTKSEVAHFVKSMRSRITEIEKATRSAEAKLATWDMDAGKDEA